MYWRVCAGMIVFYLHVAYVFSPGLIRVDPFSLANAFFPIQSIKLNFAPGSIPVTTDDFKLAGVKERSCSK